ncbi:GNAT family N-acetyltransferase [Plantactinospora sp. KBS50]|uniref:GNAT family N-acetyltransferase n=1 Tax=Plantactinospora sp. KBS50 TaxID=2024580 RepID=UPI000BAAC473|nr:GNAT family N-acetyltransferase [Plantactinospora sp. KBS50]ASW56647.1 GNAT family N-acetyltransferase [Plantactinospora sp. KBS50]
MLRPEDVGHRIVVRRTAGTRAGRPLFTDALGELAELTDTHLTVLTTDGPVRIPLSAVHRAKRVPAARRPATTRMAEVERAAEEGWPAPVRERLGDWVLRAADGWTGRANSALPLGDPGRPLDAALDAVQAWYAERGLPALVNVPLPLAAPVGAALDRRGWRARPPVLVQTAPLATIRTAAPPAADPTAAPATDPTGAPATGPTAAPPAADPTTAQPEAGRARPPGDARIELRTAPSDGWLGLVTSRKGGRLPEAARHVLTAVDQIRFAHAHPPGDDGPPVAIARGTVTGDGRWLGLSLIEVVPAARRRGLARGLVRALADWAAGLGATHAYLQVEEHNTAAVALYRSLGFRTHHGYVTRERPPTAG